MNTFYKIAFISCILFVLSQHADGLTCYSCNGCNDPFNATRSLQTTNATSGMYCTKIVVLTHVNRGIANMCTTVNIIGDGTWCCQTDYCNEATKLVSTSSLAFALIVAAALKFLY